MNTYIITEWSQLQYVPKNQYDYSINVTKFNTKNQIGTNINIIKENIIVCSILVDYVTINTSDLKPYSYNKSNALSIINSFGFNILFYDDIVLNEEEINILNSVYNLGYSYIQLIEINTINKVVISKQQLNSYSTEDEYLELYSIINYNSNCFKWMEHNLSYSIPLLLNINDKGCEICGCK